LRMSVPPPEDEKKKAEWSQESARSAGQDGEKVMKEAEKRKKCRRRRLTQAATSAACRCYAAPDSSDVPLHTSTILPFTPPCPSNSCACLASARGKRCAISGLIFRCCRRSNRAIKSCRNNTGLSRLSHWML